MSAWILAIAAASTPLAALFWAIAFGGLFVKGINGEGWLVAVALAVVSTAIAGFHIAMLMGLRP